MNLTNLEQSQKLKAWGAPQDTRYSWFEDMLYGGTPFRAYSPATKPLFEHEPNRDEEGYICAAYDLESLIEWLKEGEKINPFFSLSLIENKWLATKGMVFNTGFGNTPLEAVMALAESINKPE